MTDLLDRVIGPALDLLECIDASLERFGAPPEHAVWPLARRIGVLPATAVEHFSGLTPDALRDTAVRLRDMAESCHGEVTTHGEFSWRGSTAEAFGMRWTEISGQLTGDGDSLAGCLDATAGYLTDVADWIVASRRRIAGELGTCLGGPEAVALRGADESNLGPDRSAIVAAADLGARILDVVSQCVDDGWQVRQRWAGLLGETPARSRAALESTLATHIELR